DGWVDLLPPDEMRIHSPVWSNYEWYLRHILYRDKMIDDDFAVTDEMACFASWDLAWDDKYPDGEPRPRFTVDREKSQETFDRTRDVFGDILNVREYICFHMMSNQPGEIANIHGKLDLEQMMFDMYDEPETLHRYLKNSTRAMIDTFRQMEASGLLIQNTQGHYTDSGGNGWTDSLPPKKQGDVKLCDMWGFGVAQEFSEVSPEMHKEFGIDYQKQILELFGLSSYGCCEPYTNKFDILKEIKNLRRISCSPWCDLERASEALGRDYILSVKINPSVMIYEKDENVVREYIRQAVRKTKNNCSEYLLKDIIRLDKPGMKERFLKIGKILREECS
ncbi:MAG TPA: hypothetical protein PLT66_06405, partial [Bacillota bacterium]|nr:hypothetical protein [Bacillota bacterium]